MVAEASTTISIQNILKASVLYPQILILYFPTSIFISNPLLLQGAAMGAVIASSKKYKSDSPKSHLSL